jgi:hypothetical protein
MLCACVCAKAAEAFAIACQCPQSGRGYSTEDLDIFDTVNRLSPGELTGNDQTQLSENYNMNQWAQVGASIMPALFSPSFPGWSPSNVDYAATAQHGAGEDKRHVQEPDNRESKRPEESSPSLSQHLWDRVPVGLGVSVDSVHGGGEHTGRGREMDQEWMVKRVGLGCGLMQGDASSLHNVMQRRLSRVHDFEKIFRRVLASPNPKPQTPTPNPSCSRPPLPACLL